MKNVYKGLCEPFSEYIEVSYHGSVIFIYIRPQTIHKTDPLLLSIASLRQQHKIAEAIVKQEHCKTNYKVSDAGYICFVYAASNRSTMHCFYIT